MSTSKYKLVYADWLDLPTGRVPISNGMHPKVIDWMRSYVEQNPVNHPDNNYGRVYELESTYLTPGSGVLFHHVNLFYYFKTYYGIENVVSADQIDPNDDCTYFMPYEIEGRNIECFYRQFPFTVNNEEIIYKFVDTIPSSILDYVKSGKIKFMLSSLTEFSHGKDTLVRLEYFFRKMGFDPKNVIYLMGNIVNNYTGDIVQGFSHASLEQQAEIGNRYPIPASSLGYPCDYPRVDDLDPSVLRPKKYLCWNRTMNRPHRLAIAYIALKHDLLKDGLFSFLNALPPPDKMTSQLMDLITDDVNEVNERAKIIRDIMPYELDTQTLTPEGRESFQTNENNKKEFYLDTYLHITSETIFDAHSSPFMSEKTFRPILNLQPFIYIGNYKGLEELRRLGFKTFDGYIDESYDLIQDPKERFAMIEKEIKRFSDMSMQELHDWYYSMTDILIYNQQHFLTFKGFNPLKDLFDRY